MTDSQPRCVLHPEREAVTTAAKILVCVECERDYHKEGRQYLQVRSFYDRLLEAERELYLTALNDEKEENR